MQVVFVLSVVLVFGGASARRRVRIPLSDYVWDPYPLDMLPWVEEAFDNIASNDAKMALLYHAWNILPQHGIKVTRESVPTGDEEALANQFETNDQSERDLLTSGIHNLLKDVHRESLLQDRMGIAFDDSQRTSRAHRVAFLEGPDVEDQIAILGVRGTPGQDFPDYQDIPDTSFSCADKGYIPGFYADLETGCQAFHVCWPHMKETFLCPIGTLFNQAILSCDFWYSSNCSLAPLLYDLNARVPDSVFYREETGQEPPTQDPVAFIDWTRTPKFHPMSSKTEMYPEAEKNDVKRRHVPCPEDSASTDCTTTTPSDDVEDFEVTTQTPRLRKVRINSKFIVQPVLVIGRETWDKKLKEVVEEATTHVQGDEDGHDQDSKLCEMKTTMIPRLARRRLLSIVKELVGESLEDLGESVGRTVAVV